jgi:hypothetical protein
VSATQRLSKADAIRRARELRSELLKLIANLEMPGPAKESAKQRATAIFEKARSLESTVVRLRRREE